MSLTIEELKEQIVSCKSCGLCHTLPEGTTPVPFTGNHKAKLMLIGEAPGKEEQDLGEPFVGLCGKFLTKMLKEIGLSRQDVFIDNTVKCLPLDGNKCRPPTQMEIQSCKHHVRRAINIVKPKVIVTLGKTPTATILGGIVKKNFAMKDVVGNYFELVDYNTIVIPNYHPSYLLQHGRKQVDVAKRILEEARDLAYGKNT